MGTVNGVDIRLGQVWGTRNGEPARVISTTAGKMFPILANIDGVPQSYTTTGHWYGTREPHPRDLVNLLCDVAGDSHEATTFHPLPASTGCGNCAEMQCGSHADCSAPRRESVEFVEGDTLPVPEAGTQDFQGAPLQRAKWPPAPGKHEPTLAEPSTAPLPMSVEMMAAEADTVLGVPAPEGGDAYTDARRAREAMRAWASTTVADGLNWGEHRAPAFIDPARTNPKDVVGDKKAAMHLVSPIAELHWMVGQYAGMLKYGAWNWRAAGVRSSVYISAARRHLMAYLSGEEFDPVDGSHHLGNIMACCSIMLEAGAIGKLTDDRPPRFSHRPTLEWAEDRMAQLKVQYADKAPRHYTIADSAECGGQAQSPAFERKRADDTEGGAA